MFEFVNKYILQPFIDFVKNIFETDWSNSFGVIGEVMNTFLGSMKKIWGDIKEVFNGVIKFITGIFSGNWKKAWEGIKDIFQAREIVWMVEVNIGDDTVFRMVRHKVAFILI